MTAAKPELGFPRERLYLIAAKPVPITAAVDAVVVYSSDR